MSRDSRRVVHLADLQRYVFTEDYNPQKTPAGAHEFTFIESSGTVSSLKMVYLLDADVSRCQGVCEGHKGACQERKGSSETLTTTIIIMETMMTMTRMTIMRTMTMSMTITRTIMITITMTIKMT